MLSIARRSRVRLRTVRALRWPLVAVWLATTTGVLLGNGAGVGVVVAWTSLALGLLAASWWQASLARRIRDDVVRSIRSAETSRDRRNEPPTAISEKSRRKNTSGTKRTGIREVGILADKLWAGFYQAAESDLITASVRRDFSAAARSRAMYELARWHGSQGDQESALRDVQLSRALDPSPDGDALARRTLLEVDFLILSGQADAARELLDSQELDAGLSKIAPRRANIALRSPAGRVVEQLSWLNRLYLDRGFVGVERRDFSVALSLDNIVAQGGIAVEGGPLVSVIVPAYRAEATLRRSVQSILAQSWQRLEVIIIDDCSDDATRQVADDLASQDARIVVESLAVNGGAYAARNFALEIARGEFVTVHDSDDWAHPQKIETQVRALQATPDLMATMSHHARVADGLLFTMPSARPDPKVIIANFSSLMFRREVFEQIGPWDAVRVGADSELLRRVEAFYGSSSVARLEPEVPLSLVDTQESSLTLAGPTGVLALHHFVGSRRNYRIAYERWHASETFTKELPLSRENRRPFIAPRISSTGSGGRASHVDVLMMSNFALPGGTTASNIQEIQAQRRAGLTTGLLHHPIYSWPTFRAPNPKVLGEVDGDRVRFISSGEEVSCETMVVRFPRIFEQPLDVLPRIDARRVVLVVNQPPQRTYGGVSDETTYHLGRVIDNLQARYGDVEVAPIGPLVRRTLVEHHSDEFAASQLRASDWLNIIDVDFWSRRSRRLPDGCTRIGRHSRDAPEKWPETAESLLAAYPDRPDYDIRVLGGSASAEAVIGTIPENWTTLPFDSVTPRAFLHSLDVYSYFTASTWVEAFGRCLLEAMAAGVPVVTSPAFADLFGDAATYSSVAEVADRVDELMRDEMLYSQQVQRAYRMIASRFSFEAHIARLREMG